MTKETSIARGVSALIAKIKKTVLSTRAKDYLAEQYCIEAREMILARTLKGYGVDRDGGSLKRLKRLSSSYIKYRQRNKNRLASYTSPTTSNITFSGELLSSLGVKRRKPGNWQLVFQGTHGSGISNARLAKIVSRDRPFLNLAKSEQAELGASYRRNFSQLVNRGI